uniref:Uncharacterized protein n=1 Tax=Heliothis virescens TaxID=7102 RepID=A0A2A4J238_HELVI
MTAVNQHKTLHSIIAGRFCAQWTVVSRTNTFKTSLRKNPASEREDPHSGTGQRSSLRNVLARRLAGRPSAPYLGIGFTGRHGPSLPASGQDASGPWLLAIYLNRIGQGELPSGHPLRSPRWNTREHSLRGVSSWLNPAATLVAAIRDDLSPLPPAIFNA